MAKKNFTVTKKPNAPKHRKFPDQPAASATLKTWENYHEKCKTVKAYNDEKDAIYAKKLKEFEAYKKYKDELKEKARKLKSK